MKKKHRSTKEPRSRPDGPPRRDDRPTDERRGQRGMSEKEKDEARSH